MDHDTQQASLEAKIDALTAQVAWLAERERVRAEMFDEAGPILKEVMAVAGQRLDRMDQDGWFEFGGAAMGIVERVVQNYTREDVDLLGQSIVAILDTVRSLTQPEILDIAHKATEIVEHSDELEPVGVMGMLKASTDADVKRGTAVVLEVLRLVGQGAEKAARKAPRGRQDRLAARLGPKFSETAPRPPRPAAPARAPAAAQAAPAAQKAVSPKSAIRPNVPGKDHLFGAEGFLVDSSTWDEALGAQIAQSIGIALTDEHWKVVRYVRAYQQEHGSSPNVRKITLGSGVDTRTLYTLFPHSPGKATAMIAGVPKPVGCI